MSVFSGDFLGFQLGEVHSSSLNLTRVSSGGWYTDNLIPNFTDLTANVPGADGTYYWGTDHTQRTFTIDFAFDNLYDVDLKRLQRVFGFKGVQKLIFDEYPYKQYMVKCSSPPTFKYICFDQNEYRIYKGEGSVQLTAFYPYATATSKQKISYDKKGCSISNVGDIECGFDLIFGLEDNEIPELTIELEKKSEIIKKLYIDKITLKQGDKYIEINGSTHLIEGLDENFEKTGNLYNSYIKEGNFFNLPIGINKVKINKEFVAGSYTPLYF